MTTKSRLPSPSDSPKVPLVQAMLLIPEEKLSTVVLVEQLDWPLMKLWSCPFLAQTVAVRDVTEVELLEEPDPVTNLDRIKTKRVVSRANWCSYDIVCPEERAASSDFQSFLTFVEANGGFWERLGDLYAFYWPPEVQLKPKAALASMGFNK